MIRDSVSKLSQRDTCILKWLLPFLNDVATHSKGMTLESLAICFAPSLFEPMQVSMENPLKSIQDQKMDRLCKIDPDLCTNMDPRS